MKKWIFPILVLIFAFSGFNFAFSQEKIEIHFFYGKICPHCADEQKFLDEIEKKYPEVKINRYLVSDPENQELLRELCKKCDVEKYMGLVPLTFVGEDFFLGFDSPEGIGRKIEDSIQRQIKGEPSMPDQDGKKIKLSIIGEIDISKYSLPVLAVILGFFDGFNICSLGALVLILGLVLAFRTKSKTLILGGIFILTTAIIYGILIFLWYQLFSALSPYIRKMEIVIGILALVGGGYFLKEFLKFRKRGPVCEFGGISQKLSQKIQKIFEKKESILALIGAILLFAVIITVVEFPCSAVLPVIFAGILSEAHLSTFLSLLYIGIFLLFYMADEIIIFLISVFTMKLWIASPKFVTFLNLITAIMLFFLGIYYLVGLV